MNILNSNHKTTPTTVSQMCENLKHRLKLVKDMDVIVSVHRSRLRISTSTERLIDYCVMDHYSYHGDIAVMEFSYEDLSDIESIILGR